MLFPVKPQPGSSGVDWTVIKRWPCSLLFEFTSGCWCSAQVIAVARTADLVLMMLDATKQDVQRVLLEKELESVGIRLNKEKPNIYFKVRLSLFSDVIPLPNFSSCQSRGKLLPSPTSWTDNFGLYGKWNWGKGPATPKYLDFELSCNFEIWPQLLLCIVS